MSCQEKLFTNCVRFKMNFSSYVDEKIIKCNKLPGLIRRLSMNSPRNALLTLYKSFIRPHLDYGGILYNKPNNGFFQNKIETVQYRAYRVRIYELRVPFTSYESNPRVTSSNPRNIKSIKTEVNSLKSSSFCNIVSPKLFGNSWLYFQLLVIISCFTFPPLHG